VKEPGLERFLRYDRWSRHAFRVMIFDPSRTHADYEALELREDAGFAGGAFTVKSSAPHDAEIFRADALLQHGKTEASAPKVLLIKQYSFGPAPHGCEVACEISLKLKEPLEKPVAIGIESVINLLARQSLTAFSRRHRQGKSSLQRLTARPILRMETAGSVSASPCTHRQPMNSGLRRSKRFRNPREVSSASTRARKFLPSGAPASPPRSPGPPASSGGIESF